MAGTCDFDGCCNASPQRHLCAMHYARGLRARRRAGLPIRHRNASRLDRASMDAWSAGSDQQDRVAYLRTLNLGELQSYCTGVLSRASILGTPAEIEGWQRILRQAVRRAS